MGCGSSKNVLATVDDSVHVMIKHDRKVAMQKGQPAATAYKPREVHPLLQAQHNQNNDNNNTTTAAAAEVAATEDQPQPQPPANQSTSSRIEIEEDSD